MYDICLSPSDLLQYVNSMIISTSIHVAANGMISFFFYNWVIWPQCSFLSGYMRWWSFGLSLGFQTYLGSTVWPPAWPHCIEGEHASFLWWTPCDPGKAVVSVHLGCCNKISQIRWIISHRNVFRTLLKAGSPRWGCQHGCLGESLLLGSHVLPSSCALT